MKSFCDIMATSPLKMQTMPQPKEEAMFFIKAMEKINEPSDWFMLAVIGGLLIVVGLVLVHSAGVSSDVIVFAEIAIVLTVIYLLAGLVHILWDDTPEMKRERRQQELNKKKKGEQ